MSATLLAWFALRGIQQTHFASARCALSVWRSAEFPSSIRPHTLTCTHLRKLGCPGLCSLGAASLAVLLGLKPAGAPMLAMGRWSSMAGGRRRAQSVLRTVKTSKSRDGVEVVFGVREVEGGFGLRCRRSSSSYPYCWPGLVQVIFVVRLCGEVGGGRRRACRPRRCNAPASIIARATGGRRRATRCRGCLLLVGDCNASSGVPGGAGAVRRGGLVVCW